MPMNRSPQSVTRLSLLTGIILAVNVIANYYYVRIDLTADKRYTLSDSTKQLLKNLDDQVMIRVFLKGNYPGGLRRLSVETRELLEEMKVIAGNRLHYEFVNPTEGKTEEEVQAILLELAKKGLEPTNVQVRKGDEYSQQLVIPGALMYYKGKEAAVPLLISPSGMPAQQALNVSLGRLEYQLLRALRQLSLPVRPKIAFIQGHNELPPIYCYDLWQSLSSFYDVEELHLPQVLRIDPKYQLVVIARPRSPWHEKDKFKLDQYIMNGGRVLWLVETVAAEMDSVVRKATFLAVDIPLNLEDQLFRYGVRINPNLVMDLQCRAVPLVIAGQGQKQQFARYPCFYFPVSIPHISHPIVEQVDAVAMRFANTIDTLVGARIKKTPLLTTSARSRMVFTPWLVDFRALRNRPVVQEYNQQHLLLAVLLEGKFTSVFRNRLAPEFEKILKDSLRLPFRSESPPTKMIVISDADIAINDFDAQGRPLDLGYDRFNGTYYGNLDFLLNSIDYLAGMHHFIQTRNKTIQLRLFDSARVRAERIQWQILNVCGPIVLLLLGGSIFVASRKRIFGRL